MSEEKPKRRKLKPGMGKSKGSGFESQTAKKLSAALAPLNFMRSPGSGARLGGKNFEKFGEAFGEEAMSIFVADVVPINEKKEGLKFLHSVECKFYRTPDSFTQLVAGSANIFKWFEESFEDAKKTDKNPILICKWNNTPTYAIFDLDHPNCPNSIRLQINAASIVVKGGENKRNLGVYLIDEILKDVSVWVEKA